MKQSSTQIMGQVFIWFVAIPIVLILATPFILVAAVIQKENYGKIVLAYYKTAIKYVLEFFGETIA